MKLEEFLGDGVYVKYDGFSLWLRAPRGIDNDHYVALEPAVFAAFMRFVEDNTELLDVKSVTAEEMANAIRECTEQAQHAHDSGFPQRMLSILTRLSEKK